jgi:glycosyltransferase involved in cell wall biosynthesis
LVQVGKRQSEVSSSRSKKGVKRALREAKQSESPLLSLAIPLYDEEGNVRSVTADILAVFRNAGVPLQLILVDNGSHDSTRTVVEELEANNAEVYGVYLDQNQGYGGGILAGIAEATPEAEMLGYMWGDGQIEGSDVVRVYRRMVSEQVDLAKARRVERIDGWRRALISRCYNTLTLWLFHITSPDTNGCPKIFTRESWELLNPKSTDWFLDAELMIGVAQKDLRHAEVDVIGKARHSGQSKVGTGTVFEFCINLMRTRTGN